MKLNKPPVTEEQSILEEYVDFLLLDNSNVHPLKIKHSHNKNKQEANENNSAEIRNKTIRKIENNTDKVSLTKHVKQDNSAKTSITQIIDEKKAEENTTDLTDTLKEKSELNKEYSQPTVPSKVTDNSVEEAINKVEQLENTTASSHQYVEESEEEQLKEWNALLGTNESLMSSETIVDEKEPFNSEVDSPLQNDNQSIKEKDVLEKKHSKFKQKETYQKKRAEQNESQSIKKTSQYADTTQQLINEYLPAQKDERLAGVEKLLSRISLATMPKNAESEKNAEKIQTTQNKEQVVESEATAEATQATFIQREVQRNKEILPDVFQTLIFQVAKLPLAVPLLKLGGISKITQEDITPLVGTPDWFLGLVPNERGNLMVIDTQKYLMPEQAANRDDTEYQYLIILDDSNWALACHGVGDAKNLTTDDIRWSEKTSKRPWFAGMVVEFMSALIEVDELINMLAKNIVE